MISANNSIRQQFQLQPPPTSPTQQLHTHPHSASPARHAPNGGLAHKVHVLTVTATRYANRDCPRLTNSHCRCGVTMGRTLKTGIFETSMTDPILATFRYFCNMHLFRIRHGNNEPRCLPIETHPDLYLILK